MCHCFEPAGAVERPVDRRAQSARVQRAIRRVAGGYFRVVLRALDRRFARFKDLVTKILSERRGRWAWFDHVACAVERYRGLRGDREAATVTYHGFLSFFPLVAVGFAILGYLVDVMPGVRAGVDRQIEAIFPGLVGDSPGQINAQAIANARAGVGTVGLVLLLYTGSAWVSSLREAVHAMWWGRRDGGSNPIVGKMTDLSVLALLGLVTLGSVLVSGAANWLARRLVDLLGMTGTLATIAGRSVIDLASVLVNAVLFAIMYWRLSGRTIPPHLLWRGALLASVGFEILRFAASLLLGHTLLNPLYTSYAFAVGMLIWINLTTRLILFAAAWTATSPALRSAPPPGA